MKKRVFAAIFVMALCIGILGGCGSKSEPVSVNVGSLKGPTSIGMIDFMATAQNEESANQYNFEIMTAADELTAKLVKGKLDIALLPANAACAVYNKTEGQIKVIDINVLGALYIVSGEGNKISSMTDLEGKTVYLTGKGTTPEYVLRYLIKENKVKNVDLQFKGEATEIVSAMAKDSSAIGLLPQPFATAAMAQNDKLKICLDMTEEWNKVNENSQLVTGVAVVRTEFAEKNPEVVEEFMSQHENSIKSVNENPKEASKLVEEKKIVAKAQIAEKAIPYCSLVYIDGKEMKDTLEGYLKVLFEQNPKAIGGKTPGEDFYY